MKSLIFTLAIYFFISLLPKKTMAQDNPFSALYLSVEMGGGNFFFGGANLTYLHDDSWSLSVGHSNHFRYSKAMPSIYERQTVYWNWPEDQIRGIELLVGKIFPSEPGALARFNLQAGIAFTKVQFTENWRNDPQAFYGWSYDMETRNTVSLVIHPRLEFPFTRVFGLFLNLRITSNLHQTAFGGGGGIMLGLLRRKRKK